MKLSKVASGLIWLALFMLGMSIPAFSTQSPLKFDPGTPPEGLTVGEWKSVQDQIQVNACNIEPSGDGQNGAYSAVNHQQGYSIEFQKDAIQVIPENQATLPVLHLGLSLTGYGYGDAIRAVPRAEIVAKDNRVEYRRGNITEWYVNDGNGLEQGFTIQTPPAHHAPGFLTLRMAMDGLVLPEISADGKAVILKNPASDAAFRFEKLMAFDSNGVELPAHFEIDDSRLSISVDDRNAVYPIIVDPVILYDQQLLPSYQKAYDGFGSSVAISGDYMVVAGKYWQSVFVFSRRPDVLDSVNNWCLMQKIDPPGVGYIDYRSWHWAVSIDGDTMVVGADEDDDKGINAGAVYVYKQESNEMFDISPFKLTASDAETGDKFGRSVIVRGDTVLVGAPFDDDMGENSGSAYIFNRNEGVENSWRQIKKLIASDGAADDGFGESVSIDGQMLAVGAPGICTTGALCTDGIIGAAYVFDNVSGDWELVKKLADPDGSVDDNFGLSISIHGDTIAVGNPYDDYNGNDSGSVSVFNRNEGGENSWGRKMKIAGPSAGKKFGWSVCLEESTMIIGAKDGYAGSAFVYVADETSTWNFTKQLSDAHLTMGLEFGNSVSVSGDVVVVGGPGNGSYFAYGNVSLFGRNKDGDGNWGLLKEVEATDAGLGEWFGTSVSVHDNSLVIGAPEDQDLTWNNGAAYVFKQDEENENSWQLIKKISAEIQYFGNDFGRSVSIHEDIIAAGAAGYNGHGGVCMFVRNHGGTDNWGKVQTLIADDAQDSQKFGSSVEVNESLVIIGATEAAYIFEYNPETDKWYQIKKLLGDGLSGKFSCAVSLDGNLAAVGASEGTGSVYLFGADTGGISNWGLIKKIPCPTGESENANFGSSLSLRGDTLAAGVPGSGLFGSESGAAYVFYRNSGGEENWGQVKKLISPSAQKGEKFGYSLSLEDNLLMVKCYRGSGHVFNRNAGGYDNWWPIAELPGLDGSYYDSAAISGKTALMGMPGATYNGMISGAAMVYGVDEVPFAASISLVPPPTEFPTNSSTLKFRIEFSEKVDNVGADDFQLVTTGSINGTLNTEGESETTTIMTVTGITGEGTLALTLRDNDSIVDAAGNPLCGNGVNCEITSETCAIDRIAPRILNVYADQNGDFKAGDTIFLNILFDEPVEVEGSPKLKLNAHPINAWAVYDSGSGTNALVFKYTVADGHNAFRLDYTGTDALDLSGGVLKDRVTNDAVTTPPLPGTPGSIGRNNDITIDTTPPVLMGLADDSVFRTAKSWTWMADGGDPSIRYRHYLNQDPTGAPSDEYNWEASHYIEGLEGLWYLHVQAIDQAGNESPVATVSTRFDNTAPSSIVASPEYANGLAISVTWSAEDPTDGSGINTGQTVFYFRVGEGTVWNGPNPASISPFNFSTFAGDGRYCFDVIASDQVENREDGPHENAGAITIWDKTAPVSSAYIDSAERLARIGDTIQVHYAVTGENDSQSPIDEVTLYVVKPDGVQITGGSMTDGELSGVFQFRPEPGVHPTGSYEFYTVARDKAGNLESTPAGYDDYAIYNAGFAGYAILAVGGLASDPSGLDDHTHTANMIYDYLVHRGFAVGDNPADPLDHIKYFNPKPGITEIGEDAIGLPTYFSGLRSSVVDWALTRMSAMPGPLYIILADHGSATAGVGRFYLDPYAGSWVDATAFDSWLDELEEGLDLAGVDREKTPIVIAVGSCYSGSFIESFKKEAGETTWNRIILTSTAPDEVSYRGPEVDPALHIRDGELFLSGLFNELVRVDAAGEPFNLNRSFQQAVSRVETMTDQGIPSTGAPALDPDFFDYARQHPLIDDTGDGFGANNLTLHGTDEGVAAESLVLGVVPDGPYRAAEVMSAGAEFRYIPAPGVSTTLWAKAAPKVPAHQSLNPADVSVWVGIRPPNILLPGPSGKTVSQTVGMHWYQLDRYMGDWQWELDENDFGEFFDPGRYFLYFYAKTVDGIWSPFVTTIVYKLPPSSSCTVSSISLLSPSLPVTQTPIVLDWSDASCQAGNAETIAYQVAISEHADMSSPMLEKNITASSYYLTAADNLPGSVELYWQVTAVAASGDQETSAIGSFTIDNNNPSFVKIEGHVVEAGADPVKPVAQADVDVGGYPAQSEADGFFQIVVPYQADYDVIAKAAGYDDWPGAAAYALTGVEEESTVSLTIEMFPEDVNPMGDVDGENGVTLADAILALKVLAGVEPLPAVVHIEADINPTVETERAIGLEEAIFILQKTADLR